MKIILELLLEAIEKNGSIIILQLLGVGLVLLFLMVLVWAAKVKFLTNLKEAHKASLENQYREEFRQEIRREEIPKLRKELADQRQTEMDGREKKFTDHQFFDKLALVSNLHATHIKGRVRKDLFTDMLTDYFYLLQANLKEFMANDFQKVDSKELLRKWVVTCIQSTNVKIRDTWRTNKIPEIVIDRMLTWLRLRTGAIEGVILQTVSFKTWDHVADIMFDLLDLIWFMQSQIILNGAEMFAVLNGELTGQTYKDRIIE